MPRFPFIISILSVLAGGCTMGPHYTRPQFALPGAWQAPRPHGGDGKAIAAWWSRFSDPTVGELQTLAEKSSPTLDAAIGRIKQARATLRSSRANALPSVTGSASYSEAGQDIKGNGQAFPVTNDGSQLGLDASWEIDLFGKARRNNEAASARIDARIDDWHDARVSLAAEVADTYFRLRGCEQLADVLTQQARSQGESARLTRISARAGLTAPADAELADASAASVRSSSTDQQAQCDLLVKSMVSLTGLEDTLLRQMLAPRKATLPAAPQFEVTSVPADTLRQRPDVVSSERELAASSAEIGAAIADLYPSISLTGSISNNDIMRQWSFGPSLSLPIFDGRRRKANVNSARAAYDIRLASYRQTVRSAILEVEQALVRLQSARDREGDAERAAQGYQNNFAAIDQLRRAGSASTIDRESAFRNFLGARHTLIDLHITQIREWIALYKALGGGWQLDTPAPDHAAATHGVSGS